MVAVSYPDETKDVIHAVSVNNTHLFILNFIIEYICYILLFSEFSPNF